MTFSAPPPSSTCPPPAASPSWPASPPATWIDSVFPYLKKRGLFLIKIQNTVKSKSTQFGSVIVASVPLSSGQSFSLHENVLDYFANRIFMNNFF